jgi:RNA polymerase sigma-70 factor (ECF subfamily)
MDEQLVGIHPDALVKARTAIEAEFEAGLAGWSSLAFRVAYSVLRQREDAEDIAQDVLTKAHRNLGQLRDHARLQAWIVRMAWRMAINRRGADNRRTSREQAPVEAAEVPSPEELALSAQRSEQLWAAIDGLSEKLRMVVVLASIQGHDLVEVASALGIPEGTVKSRLFEARRLIREQLR